MPLELHTHNGIDSPKVKPIDLRGFPIFTTVPTHNAEEGNIVISTSGGVNLYIFQGGVWKVVGSSTTPVSERTQRLNVGAGQQAITGVGFRPSLVTIYSSIQENDGGWCNGRGTSDSDFDYIEKWWDGTYIRPYTGNDRIIRLHKGADITDADIYSIDSDGFTLDWKNMNDNVSFIYTCYK